MFGDNPITIGATSTTYQGMQTLTGVFHFITDGNSCATKNVTKNIWLGKPAPAGQKVDGVTYYPGFQICPGNHWVGITWNGPVNSTNWTVTPGIVYTTNNSECDFTLPSSGIPACPSPLTVQINVRRAAMRVTTYLRKPPDVDLS